MKKFFALVALAFAIVACCAPRAAPVTPTSATLDASAPDDTAVRAWKTFELTLHVDVDFAPAGRALIEEAAHKWREISGGHIRIDVVFDVDFDETEELAAHVAARHSILLGVKSDFPIVKKIDARLGRPGSMPLAVTLTADDRPTTVFLIVDRIRADDFLSSSVTSRACLIFLRWVRSCPARGSAESPRSRSSPARTSPSAVLISFASEALPTLTACRRKRRGKTSPSWVSSVRPSFCRVCSRPSH